MVSMFAMLLIIELVSATNPDPKCDVEIKELDIYQMGINLNLTQETNFKKFELLQHHNLFTIQHSTGFLQTVRSINRESLCQPNHECDCLKRKCLLKIVIFAFDPSQSNKPPNRISKNICIEDVNDNKPSFLDATLNINLNEKSSIGTQVDLNSAHDLDSADFAINNYDLKCQVNIFNLSFSIIRDNQYQLDHQVKLIVTKNISYRTDPIQCTLTAYDIDFRSSMRIFVKINDINDHIPQWVNPKQLIKIKENIPVDSVIHTFQATDLDADYGRILYSVSRTMLPDNPKTFSANVFTIDQSSGDLRVSGNIDYEERTQRRFIVTVVAKDNGTPPLSSSTTLTVDVEDVNDNIPIIGLNKVNIDIEENSPPNYLDYFTVVDIDEGANGRIECEIQESSEYFSLNKSNSNSPITYEIYLMHSLDHEKQAIYSVTIQCQDGGKPNLTSRKRITVSVIDVNDNQVYFPQKVIYISIPENIPIGTEIMKISTVDLDKKSDILYSFVDPINCTFVNIDSYNGYLTTNEIFDRELKDEFMFEIQVTEKDNVNFTDIAKVVLRINDINDNKPAFDEYYSFSVPENMSVEGFVGKVRAVDPDLGENGTIWYTQVSQMANNPIYFTVSNNGDIRLFYKLDFEKQNIHQVIVIAKDQGRPSSLSSSTTVLITVLDSNNNPPKFDEHSFTLSLNCQTQTIDKNLFPVTDRDKSLENIHMNYQLENIKPVQYKQIFSIDKVSGTITMNIRKDQCDFKLKDKEKIEITILVYDPTKPEFRDKTVLNLYLENERYHKNLNENNNRPGSGEFDMSHKSKIKISSSESESITKPDEFPDQNIIIIIVLIFVILFLGIFLISIVCFVKKKRQSDEEQDLEENTIMVREKVNPSIQSSKSDYNENIDSYQMPLKKIGSNTIRNHTNMDSLRNKILKLDMTSCPSSVQNPDQQLDKALLQYEMTKMKENNTYQSLTMNSKWNSLDQESSIVNPFQSNLSTHSRSSFQNKNINLIQNTNVPSQPNNRPYVSVSFV